MKKELVQERALAIAADYLVTEGFCTLESVANCRKKRFNDNVCQKCVLEMLMYLGRREAQKAEELNNEQKQVLMPEMRSKS